MKPEAAPQRMALALPGGASAMIRVVVNRRARRVSLRIDPAAGEVVAVAPSPRDQARARAFALERVEWIAAALAGLPPAAPLCGGATIPFRGAPMRLVNDPALRGAAYTDHDAATNVLRLVAGGLDEATFAARVRRFLVAEAREALIARVAAHAATLGVAPSRVTVKECRSRWGSCSASGALSFSWRIILAPPAVLDYLAAHEVAHLREMNHGPCFWALVAACAPHHRAARAWLRRHGAALHAVGR